MFDNKHIKQNCIARFAANLKRGLRKAYGTSVNPNRYGNNYENYESYNRYSNRFSDNINTNTAATSNNMRDYDKITKSIKDEILKKITQALS